MKTNFENMNWRLALLGDHALVFSLEEKMSEEIIEKIMALKKTIESFHFDFVKELIPSYHTLSLVYDIKLFYENEIASINNESITDFGNALLTTFNSNAKNSTLKNSTEKMRVSNQAIPLVVFWPFTIKIQNTFYWFSHFFCWKIFN